MAKTTFFRKGASAVAAAALAGAMVPAAALATDGTQSSTGTGTTEVTTSSVEVTYDKDCSWTATYPTSVTMGANADGSASADISFNVKGLIDVDHQVTITPTSTSIELTGARHEGKLAATIAGPSSGAAATAVNTEAGATVTGSASATADAVKAAAVDTYKGTTTFKIQCGASEPVTVGCATFSKDGVTEELTWDQLKLEENGTKYGYDASKITDTALLADFDENMIGNSAFFSSYGEETYTSCTSLVSITIPDTVTSIDSGSFYGCSSLTTATLGSGVTSVGAEAFGECSSLTSIAIPDSVTTIGEGAFMYCSSLETATLGSGVTSIGEYAFVECASLATVTFGSGATTIGGGAFMYCSSLATVAFGSGVTSIGEYAFCGCTKLASVTIPDSVTTIGKYAFMSCTSLATVALGSGVRTIENYAFVDDKAITNYTISYSGTKSQWGQVDAKGDWNAASNIKYVHCTDGDVDVSWD